MKTIVRKNGGADKNGRKSGDRLKGVANKRVAKPAGSAPAKGKTRRRPRALATNAYHPGPPIDSEEALGRAVARLLALDPDLIGNLTAAAGPLPLRRRDASFTGLCWIIVSQQVSTASANAIFKRVETNLSPLGPATVLAADDAELRACGLSLAKMRALRALAAAVDAGSLNLATLAPLAAEEAHRALIVVKGIGPWTADVFLLFCLGHPDAFPAGDLALQEAARLALGLKKRPDATALNKIAERWRPLRGVAARLLWAYYRVARHGREGMALAGS